MFDLARVWEKDHVFCQEVIVAKRGPRVVVLPAANRTNFLQRTMRILGIAQMPV